MQEWQKLFIQRQILQLEHQQLTEDEILSKSLSILDEEKSINYALDFYKKTGSLTKTLNKIEVIKVDEKLLDIIERREKKGLAEHGPLLTLLTTNKNISTIFRLLKIRLSVGLSYAMWLSIIATIIFSVINIYVYPQFTALFNDFGTELPHLTRMAIAWQNHLLSPGIIGGLFVLSIFIILSSVHLLSEARPNITLLTYVPFINRVINLVNDIRWLGQLRILSSTGLTLKQCLDKLAHESHHLKKRMPELIKELSVSEQLGTLNAEMEYQINYLQQQSEKVVTNATRKLVALVMIVIVSYIIFALIASYLPIFQTGSVI